MAHDSQQAAEDDLDALDRELAAVAGGHAEVGDVDEHVAHGAAARAHEVMMGVLDVRVDADAAGADVEDSSTSPSASRSCTVWYTVLREMVGISARAASNSDSTVGWVSTPWRSRKIA